MGSVWGWLWLLAILPLWAINTMLAIALAVCMEKITHIQLSESFYTWSALAGLVLAIVTLGVIDCLVHIGLPIVGPLCRVDKA